jgi:predicted DNA-binding transcriptional regulator AlpA
MSNSYKSNIGSNYTECPRNGLVRIWDIIGCKQRRCVKTISMSASTLWKKVASGHFPQPVEREHKMTQWHAEDIWEYAKDPVAWRELHGPK